jgi:hypothetical protein
MDKIKRLILWGMVSTLVASAVAASPSTRKGSSVLHYQTRNSITGSGTGSLRLQQNEQGNSSKQTFDLRVDGLTASTTYTLAAVVADDTNAVSVADFTTDANGSARIVYSAKGQGKGKGNGAALPAVLNPLVDVHAVSVVDAATQTVAYAWINTSTDYQYLVKRNLTSAGAPAAGQISLIANNSNVNFRLNAGGLAPTSDYSLALNSNVVATATSDANGALQISEWPAGAPAILDLRLLQLLDGNTNAVLSTTLPK